MSSLVNVSWVKTGVALALLAIWLPATMWCALERAGVPFFEKCCVEGSCDGSSKEPFTGKDCCLLAAGAYQVPSSAPLLVTPQFVLSFLQQVFVEPSVDSPGFYGLSESSPLELSVAWQFVSRTALPVRAPSLAS